MHLRPTHALGTKKEWRSTSPPELYHLTEPSNVCNCKTSRKSVYGVSTVVIMLLQCGYSVAILLLQ